MYDVNRSKQQYELWHEFAQMIHPKCMYCANTNHHIYTNKIYIYIYTFLMKKIRIASLSQHIIDTKKFPFVSHQLKHGDFVCTSYLYYISSEWNGYRSNISQIIWEDFPFIYSNLLDSTRAWCGIKGKSRT